MKSIFVAMVFMSLVPSIVFADTHYAANCEYATVNDLVNDAEVTSGDVIVVPAGTCTWASTLAIPSTKGITLVGTGTTIIRGAYVNPLITISTNTTTSTRLTGLNFIQTTTSKIITITGGFANPKFRMDHCTFYTTATSAVLVVVYRSWGLIDNCTFTGHGELIHNEAWGASDASGWSENITPGSSEALYIEDCTFYNTRVDTNQQYFMGCSAIQSYNGARTVFRYNTLTFIQVDQHGTPGMIGARWWEIYNNHFIIPNYNPVNQDKWMAMRAGSGVIFNNTKTGQNTYTQPKIVLYEEDLGYPALYQVGRGKDQAPDPAYIWNNVEMNVGSGSSNVMEGRDFYLSEKPGYTPYGIYLNGRYYHPLAAPYTARNIGIDP